MAPRTVFLALVVAACGSSAGDGGDGSGSPDAPVLMPCSNLPDAPLFDEDGDGIPDACDPCPISTNNTDTDGDGVGDRCDPEKDEQNVVLAFSGFRAMPDGWTLPGGWSVVGGELVGTEAGLSPGMVSIPIVGSNHFAIQASYRVDAATATGSAESKIALAARDKRPAGTTLYTCGVTLDGAVQSVDVATDAGEGNAPGAGLFDTASLYQSGFLVDGGQASCAVVTNDNAAAQKSTSAQDGGNLMTEAGVDVAFATARFQWVMVIGRKP